MVAQPDSEPVVRHILFDENGEEVTESQPVPTAEELQQETVDDADQVCVGSSKKRRKKKRSTSKGRKNSDSPFAPSVLQGTRPKVSALSKTPTGKTKSDSNMNQIAKATADYLFAKQQATDSFKLPTIPAALYAELKKSPVIAWRKLMNVFAVQHSV